MKKPAIIIAVIAAFAVNASAQVTVYKGSEMGKAGIAQTVDITATIVAIDKSTRDITLKGPQGNEVVVTASYDVKNLDQMKVGDQVHAKYLEALVLELKKHGGLTVARQEQTEAAGAMPGGQPAGVVGRRVTVVADVVAVDPAAQSVTLQGPQRTVEVKVADPDQFRWVKTGDQVYATYTQALAMVVEPSPTK